MEEGQGYDSPNSYKPLQLYADAAVAPSSSVAAGLSSNTPNPLLLQNPPSPLTVLESEVPKQVTAQQVLYEYQQTPNAAVSNVHVNQQFQPLSTAETAPQQHVYSSQYPSVTSVAPSSFPNSHDAQSNQQVTAESHHGFIAPVHHSTVVRHGQGGNQYPISHQQQTLHRLPNQPYHFLQQYPQQQYYPALQQPQQQYGKGKYLYANGKIIYYPQPAAVGVHNAPHPLSPGVHTVQPHYPVAHGLKPQQSPQNKQFRPSPEYRQPQQHAFVPVTTSNPLTYNYFYQAPKPVKKHNTPPPVKEYPSEAEEEEEEEEENRRENLEEDEEEDDEEEGRNAHYEEEEEDDEDEAEAAPEPKKYYKKYTYEEGDGDEESAEDSEREQSNTQVIKTKPKKYYKEEVQHKPAETKEYEKKKGKVYESFYDTYTEYPKKKSGSKKYPPKYSQLYNMFDKSKNKKVHPTKKPAKKPTPKPTAASPGKLEPNMEYTIYKISKLVDGQPTKVDAIEGRQSENIPVIHTQKLYKKEWLVTKTDDSQE